MSANLKRRLSRVIRLSKQARDAWWSDTSKLLDLQITAEMGAEAWQRVAEKAMAGRLDCERLSPIAAFKEELKAIEKELEGAPF